MIEINALFKKHNLSPETKRKISVLAASAVAEAYVGILSKERLGMPALGFVKQGEHITFYLDITHIKEQAKIIIEKGIVPFIEEYKERFYKIKDRLLYGNLELYPEYFSIMGAMKILVRYVGDSDRLKEHHKLIGSFFNEIAEVYTSVEEKLTELQKQSTMEELRNNITPKKRDICTIIYDGKEWHEFNNIPDIKDNLGDDMKGTGIGKGIISGIVSFSPKKDHIYVSTMTVTADTPKMREIKAIVTDEGGILCHAAVIAKEFNIPCVVGTKNATKLLKEGDMVEIDIEKGIVKKI